ncbi:hypothetical protein Tco_0329401 [Tanacetum coccineum]
MDPYIVPATKPTIDPPVTYDDTPLIPAETPTISPITSTIPPTTPTTYYTSPFIQTDSSDDDTPDTLPLPTHEIPPIEVVPPASQILPASFSVHRRQVTLVSPGQDIPHDRPYRYHPNGPIHMMTARKSVGPLPTYHLAVRYSVDYSLSDHFTSDDSSRDSPSDSSSETSLNSSSDALSNSSFVLSIPHSSAAITERPSHSSYASPSRKRSRSPTTYVLLSSPIPGALSSVRADLLPPHKRIRSSDSVMDLEVSFDESFESFIPRETGSRVNVDVEGSDEPYSEYDINPEVQEEIDECIAYADALRAGGIDTRVVVKIVAREEVETSTRGMVEIRDDRVTHLVVSDDIPEPTQEGAIEDCSDGSVECCYVGEDQTMPSTRSRATMTREVVNELIDRRVAEALENRDAARNLEPLVEGRDEHEDINGGGNGNGGVNGNGNDNGNRGVNGNGNGGRNGNGNGNGNEGGNGYGNNNINPRGFMLEDKVERFIGGLLDNIQGNVIAAEPTRLQDAIRVANNLMDQKLKGYARNAKNKRRFDNNPRDNRRQQPHFKRQNVGEIVRPLLNTQRTPVGNHSGIVCYEFGRPRHYRKDCPKLRNQNRENKTGNNEATTRAYAIEGGANSDSNVVTDTSYAVELVDGRILETNVVLRGCTLGLLGHPFCNTPKNGSQRNMFPEALLHSTIAPVRRERPLIIPGRVLVTPGSVVVTPGSYSYYYW